MRDRKNHYWKITQYCCCDTQENDGCIPSEYSFVANFDGEKQYYLHNFYKAKEDRRNAWIDAKFSGPLFVKKFKERNL